LGLIDGVQCDISVLISPELVSISFHVSSCQSKQYELRASILTRTGERSPCIV
jgi:hypothetical protein